MSLLKNIIRLLDGDSKESAVNRYSEDLLTSLLVMAWFVEARDPYTGGHLWRVSRFSRLLASDAGMSEVEVSRIAIGGFLHDLGKVSVPDAILNKKDRLTEEEYAVIKTHPEIGLRMLSGHPLSKLAEAAVLSHHETPDGRGYPHGLAGAAIPVEARIVGICDAFDAMTSTRPYRRGMPSEKALSIIEENLGTQFDRDLGKRFIALGRTGAFDHVVSHSDSGIPMHECPMCGPIVVVRSNQVEGDKVYCRNCTGEFSTETVDGQLMTIPTGNMGNPKNVEPEADTDLIARLVRDSARALLA